jgi:hypothetical protein
MDSNEQASAPKEKDYGVLVSCVIAAGIWWFLASSPSPFALMLSAFLLGHLFLGFCVLSVFLPGPNDPERKETFVPLPQTEMERPKALTL